MRDKLFNAIGREAVGRQSYRKGITEAACDMGELEGVQNVLVRSFFYITFCVYTLLNFEISVASNNFDMLKIVSQRTVKSLTFSSYT